MLRCCRFILAGLTAVMVLVDPTPVCAQTAGDEPSIAPAPLQTGTTMRTVITVEGAPVSIVETLSPEGEKLIEARPIIEALDGEILVEGTTLSVRRAQDGALMQIDMTDGSVFANEELLGKLPDWKPRDTASTRLDINAISVITGTHATEDEAGRYTLTLDERLKPQFDLDLFVDGVRLPVPSVEPRTIGAILLVPLVDIAESLGHSVDLDEAGGTVTVTRVQDVARFKLDLNTGLVSINGDPAGVTPNVSYFDPATLLLPHTAVETLTGSHIKLEPGSDRIDVYLDERLTGSALPGRRVDTAAAETPFTPERLTFQVLEGGQAGAALSAHVGRYNTVTRYEAAGSLTDVDALQPGWLQLEVQSLSGWYATLGDATPRNRELAGVNRSRLRGATFRRITEAGNLLSVAAGIPISGTKDIGNDASVPQFAGFAAGARLIDGETGREVAASAAVDGNGDRVQAVLSAQQLFDKGASSEEDIGLQTLFVSGDLGVFSKGDAASVGVRGQADGLYALSPQSNLRAGISHEDAEFRRSASALDDELEGVFDDRVSSRTTGQISVDWRAAETWQVLPNFGAAARIGVVDANDQTSTTLSASTSSLLASTGVEISVDASVTNTSNAANGQTDTADRLAIRAQKRFDWGRVQATLNSAGSQDGRRTRLLTNIDLPNLERSFEKGAEVLLSPSVSAVISDETQFARLGASAIATSGETLGERFQINGQVSALQSVAADDAATRFFGSLSARYDLWGALRLQGGLSTDFSASTRVTLGLQGSVEFNPPRRHTDPAEGAGILNGRAFLDRNRDGIRQSDEPGVPGVRLRIRGTRLALRADQSGSYTIQNLPTGLYTVDVDVATLPLGLLKGDGAPLRATVGDGRVTHLDVPIQASGQIRGAVYTDLNGNGALDAGEPRLEGAQLDLSVHDAENGAADRSQFAASFGQYAFDGLSPGRYTISASFGGESVVVDVTLSETDLFVRQPIALPAPSVSPEDGAIDTRVFGSPP